MAISTNIKKKNLKVNLIGRYSLLLFLVGDGGHKFTIYNTYYNYYTGKFRLIKFNCFSILELQN